MQLLRIIHSSRNILLTSQYLPHKLTKKSFHIHDHVYMYIQMVVFKEAMNTSINSFLVMIKEINTAIGHMRTLWP